MTETTDEHGDVSGSDTGSTAPGSPRARAQGCACSVLANAAYRAGQMNEPCVDPTCRLHSGR